MENLSLSDGAQPGAGAPPTGPALGRGPPQQQPQLPAQMFTTAAQLLDLTDKKLMVVLRDGRKVMGVLRSWDQFANLVLQSAVERIFIPPGSAPTTTGTGSESRGLYADIARGTFLVRGENVLLLGEIDLDRDDDPPPGYDRADHQLVQSLARQKKNEDKTRETTRLKTLAALGFEGENMGEILL